MSSVRRELCCQGNPDDDDVLYLSCGPADDDEYHNICAQGPNGQLYVLRDPLESNDWTNKCAQGPTGPVQRLALQQV